MMMPIVQELLNKLREIDDSIRRRGSSHVAVSDQSSIGTYLVTILNLLAPKGIQMKYWISSFQANFGS